MNRHKIVPKVDCCGRNYSCCWAEKGFGAIIATGITLDVAKKEFEDSLNEQIDSMIDDDEDMPKWIRSKNFVIKYPTPYTGMKIGMDIKDHTFYSRLLDIVCNLTNVTKEEFYRRDRHFYIVFARMMFAEVALRCNCSLSSIGRFIKRDHSTISFYRRQLNGYLPYDKGIESTLNRCFDELEKENTNGI